MAYLGRISAVLTASTRDFSRQIGDARREVQNFARQARGVQLNLDNRALNGTLTNLQRFRRTLDEIRQLQARGLGEGLPDPRRLRDQFRLFEDLGRPLTDVKNRIESLSNSIQTQLYPELETIQTGFRNLYSAIDAGTATFAGSAAAIENLRNRLIGLGRETAVLADLNSLVRQLNSNNAGASFTSPRTRDALQQSLSLRGQAQNLPARFRTEQSQVLAVQAEENAERIERAAARLARAQLRINNEGENPSTLGERGRARGLLDRLTERQQAINLGFRREITSAQVQQVIAPEAERQADRLAERFTELAGQLREISARRFGGLIADAGQVVDAFNRGTASARQATQAVDGLANALRNANAARAAQQAADDLDAGLNQRTQDLLTTERERRLRRIQSTFDRDVAEATAPERATGSRRGRQPIFGPLTRDQAILQQGRVNEAEVRRDIRLQRDRLNEDIIPRSQRVARIADESGDQIAIRDAGRVLDLNRQINSELRTASNLRKNNDYAGAQASLQRVNALLREQQDIETQIAQRVQVVNDARRQQELFLQASGGSAEQLSQGARDAAADISTARQFRGQIASGGARVEIQREIDRTTAAVQRLQQQFAEVANSNIGAARQAEEFDRLDREIRQATQGLAGFIAARSAGAFSERQIVAAMERSRNTAGSISARTSQAAQLAFQQGLFAIDDLMSATGPLEYKLRAIGNNITQLGLLLGQSGVIPGMNATVGLAIGLGTVLAGQLIPIMIRWANAGVTTEERVKALNSALERQKNLVEQLAESYKQVADEIRNIATPDRDRRPNDLRRQVEEIEKSQAEQRRERLLAANPEVIRARATVSVRQKELEEADTVGGRVRARAALERARESQRRTEDRVAEGLSRRPDQLEIRNAVRLLTPRAQVGYTLERRMQTLQMRDAQVMQTGGNAERELDLLRRARDEAVRQGSTAVGLYQNPDAQRAAEELEQLIVRIENSIRNVPADKIALRIVEQSQKIAVSLEAANKDIDAALEDSLGGGGAVLTELSRFATSLPLLVKAAEDARNSGDKELAAAIEQDIQNIDKHSVGLRAAAAALRLFADGLSRASRAAQQDVEGARDRLDEAKRQDAGLSTPRSRERVAIAERQLSDQQDAARTAQLEIERQRAAQDDEAIRAKELLDRRNSLRGQAEAAKTFQEETSEFLRVAREAGLGSSGTFAGDIKQARDLGLNEVAADLESRFKELNKLMLESGLNFNWDRVRQSISDFEAADKAVSESVAARFQEATAEINEIDEQLRGAISGADRQRLLERRNQLQAEIQPELDRRDKVAAEAVAASARASERAASENRGLALLETPGERAAAELRQRIADINAAFSAQMDLLTDQANGIVTPEVAKRAAELRGRRDETVNRQREDAEKARLERIRQAAPAIFALSDQVQTALLQGPSRAALQASDVSTVEGSRELSRLLRGDDAARNQDLVQLQKEANELLRAIKDNPANVAN